MSVWTVGFSLSDVVRLVTPLTFYQSVLAYWRTKPKETSYVFRLGLSHDLHWYVLRLSTLRVITWLMTEAKECFVSNVKALLWQTLPPWDTGEARVLCSLSGGKKGSVMFVNGHSQFSDPGNYQRCGLKRRRRYKGQDFLKIIFLIIFFFPANDSQLYVLFSLEVLSEFFVIFSVLPPLQNKNHHFWYYC